MAGKLDIEGAKNCAGQILGAVERIAARHDWSEGDLITVMMFATIELVARRTGKFQTVEYFRDVADRMERQCLQEGGAS